MQAFDYQRVNTIDEAVALLAQHNGGARVLSGGTDLLVALREARFQTELVVDVKAIPQLSTMHYSAEDGLLLGAAVACRSLYTDEVLAAAYPGIMDAAHLIGGVQIQGRASLGGNLCNASPAADTIPALIVHRAVCTIAGPAGWRTLPVEDFCVAPGKNALLSGEFLVSIQLPAPPPGFGAAYLRFIPRNEMDIAVVGVGAAVALDAAGERFENVDVALAAVAPRPLYVTEIGDALRGRTVTVEAIDEAAALAQAAAQPISDMRGTAAYRKHLTAVMTRRTLSRAVARARTALGS